MDGWVGSMDGLIRWSLVRVGLCRSMGREIQSRSVTLDTSTLRRSHEDADAINNEYTYVNYLAIFFNHDHSNYNSESMAK